VGGESVYFNGTKNAWKWRDQTTPGTGALKTRHQRTLRALFPGAVWNAPVPGVVW